MSTRIYRYLVVMMGWILGGGMDAWALAGVANCLHDPSSIIKEGDTCWVYATSYPWTKSPSANGVYAAYSTDLVNWKEGKRIYEAAGHHGLKPIPPVLEVTSGHRMSSL